MGINASTLAVIGLAFATLAIFMLTRGHRSAPKKRTGKAEDAGQKPTSQT